MTRERIYQLLLFGISNMSGTIQTPEYHWLQREVYALRKPFSQFKIKYRQQNNKCMRQKKVSEIEDLQSIKVS